MEEKDGLLTAGQIEANWKSLLESVEQAAASCGRNPRDIKVIAVSKTHPVDLIINAMEAGVKVFGENYAQELKAKQEYFEGNNLPAPEWHFIGHLQRNKVKYLAPFVKMIHSVDSLKLAKEISKQAEKHGREIDILLQANTSGEKSKSGCEPEEITKLAGSVMEVKNIRVKGLMTIGSLTGNEGLIKKEFRLLKKALLDVNEKLGLDLKELSMGMSGDYKIAIEEGATYIRVGTTIFGPRDYKN